MCIDIPETDDHLIGTHMKQYGECIIFHIFTDTDYENKYNVRKYR